MPVSVGVDELAASRRRLPRSAKCRRRRPPRFSAGVSAASAACVVNPFDPNYESSTLGGCKLCSPDGTFCELCWEQYGERGLVCAVPLVLACSTAHHLVNAAYLAVGRPQLRGGVRAVQLPIRRCRHRVFQLRRRRSDLLHRLVRGEVC